MKVRNPTFVIICVGASVALVVWYSFLAVSLVGTRTSGGGHLSLGDLAVGAAFVVMPVGVLLSWARCWVAVTSTSVVVRNPLRRYELPLSSVDRFAILRAAYPRRRIYVCAVEQCDGPAVLCRGLVDADADARARVELLDDRLHRAREDAGLPPSPHRRVPLPPTAESRRRVVLARVGVAVLLLIGYGALTLWAAHWHAGVSSSASSPPPADQATCTALATVDTQYADWVAKAQTQDTTQAFGDLYLHDPPIGPAVDHLAAANFHTPDVELRARVADLVTRYHADPRGSQWQDASTDAIAACAALGIDVSPSPNSPPATR